jgi:HEAT repeat protein
VPSPNERRRDAVLAGHAGDEPAARRALTDPDPGTRAVALGALARLGRLGDDDLRAALADPSPAVRSRAVELAVPAPAVELLPLLADPDPFVAEQAAWALGERAPAPAAVAALSGAAGGHDDPLVREAAVAALGALGHPDGLPAVLAATTDKPAVRRRAVLALAAFVDEGPQVEAALRRALGDRDRQVRQAAEDLLG